MEKVKLPKEVAEAINDLRCKGYANVEIVAETKVGTHPDWNVLKRFVENSYNHYDLLLSALVNGYEVAMTQEDKVMEYYEKLLKNHEVWTNKAQCNTSPAGHELTGCRRTLDILGIKISGVNEE